jgi:hypothetical protein
MSGPASSLLGRPWQLPRNYLQCCVFTFYSYSCKEALKTNNKYMQPHSQVIIRMPLCVCYICCREIH